MNILFINGSPNENGNTAALANILLKGKEYETLNLSHYRVNVYGQELPGDQFDEILEKMKEAKTIVIGSPVYWHNLAGSVRTLLDRFYGPVSEGELKGRKLLLLFQGAAPEKWMLDAGEYTINRFAALYGLNYVGMATDKAQARQLSDSI
ncbi:flavodoxin family protein [Lacrimispora sp.]|uniref:flavodoxin family protein n=1 Tax=Lacrimispora sp. TaxID=2719234 RepID=UPI0034611CD0